MKQTKADKQLAQWCQALSQPTTPVEEVPEGWYTIKQLAKARGRSECITSEQVRRMIDQGMCEKRNFTIRLSERVRPVPHYRLK
jgi:predicted transcriptional regulator